MNDPEEATRLTALDRYGILDTPAEAGFDDIVLLASQMCETPVSLVSLVAGDRQWFKARVGFDLCQTPLDQSVCRHALARPGLLVISDLTADQRTIDNTLVTGDPYLRFYAGARIETPEGLALGTLCVMDMTPRPDGLTVAQASGLRTLARQVMTLLEMRRTAAARDRAESLNDLILDASDDCVVVLDLDGNNRFVSPGGLRSMEVDDVDAILGLSWLRVWTGDDHTAARQALQDARAGGVGRFHGFCPTHKGTPKWWDVVISPLRGADGTPERLVSVGRDITERRRAEMALKALNETLEQRVEARTRDRDRVWSMTNDLMGTAGFDGYLKEINPAWERSLGWGEADLLGRPWLDFIDAADHAETADAMARLAAGHSVTDLVDRIQSSDGTWRTVMWMAVPQPEAEVFHIVGRDLTEQRRTEELLRQSQKMEAVGQLTGGLAHDFNNLLTAMTGGLDLLRMRVAQGRFDEVGRYVDAAQGAAKRAAALTHRLLAFSRRQTLDPRPTDIDRLAVDMVDLIRRTVGPEITVDVVGTAGLRTALVDPNQLENALLNLCINGRDAMPEGGRIVIETGSIVLDERAARECGLPPGPYVVLGVSDTGTGMPPEVMARAFDPFFTTKPMGQGTGLGLSMIYGFARQSGGQVRIDSTIGHGTTMRLYLPQCHRESQDEDVVPQARGVLRGEQGETILVVDDEVAIRMVVTDLLSDLGYTALEAEDGATGLTVLRSDVRIDLLITDVGLPGGINGRQVADAARVLRPGLKVLFITGYAENAVIGNGQLDDGMRVLTKPFTIDDLGNSIRRMIES